MSNNRSRNRRPQRPAQDSHIDAVRPFRFKHGDQTFTIPPASEGTKRMKAGALIDMAEDGTEAGQMRFFVAMLNAAGPSEEAMAALRDMPIDRFGSVMRQWVERTGGHPGKSGPSSD